MEHFEDFLLPEESRITVKPPKGLVSEGSWPDLCKWLIQRGICDLMPLSEIAIVGGQRLLNGLFAVGKTNMTAYLLEEGEVALLSSEDIGPSITVLLFPTNGGGSWDSTG